jgi:hypothetical protein
MGSALVTLVVNYLKVIPVHDILTVLLEFHSSIAISVHVVYLYSIFLVPHGSNYNSSSNFTSH